MTNENDSTTPVDGLRLLDAGLARYPQQAPRGRHPMLAGDWDYYDGKPFTDTEIAEALLGDYTWAFLLTYPDVKYDAVTGEPHDPRTVHQFMADDGADARQAFDDTFAPDGWAWVGTCDLTSRASIDNLLTIVAEMWA